MKLRDKWKATCPCCGATLYYEDATNKDMLDNVGATLDCAKCNALLRLKGNLTLEDFGEALVKIYAEEGVEVSKEEALSNYIEF